MSQPISRRGTPSPPGSPSSRRLRAFLILGLFVAAVAGAAIAGWQFARESKPVAGPIVLVTIDGLRADHLRAYGYTAGATPHFDRLAGQSVVFERAYAHAPLTLPAHASLFTGRLPFRHQVRDDMGYALDAGTATLATQLADRGFDTGAAVSSWLLRPPTGIGRGFDDYDADLGGAAASPGQTAPAPDAAVALERDDWNTGLAAARWLAQQRSDRLFFWLHLRGPAAQRVTQAANRLAAYDASITVADAAVGALVEALRARGWYDQSLIVVTGSHGDALGEHERSHGLTLSDAVVQVPLLVKMPDAEDGRRVAEPVQHVDIVPTLLDLVRAPLPRGLDGRSLRAVLEDEAPAPARPIYVEAMYVHLQFGGAPQQALLYRGPGTGGGTAVAAAQPEAAQRDALAALLVKDAPVAPPAWTSAADRERYARLGHAAFAAEWRLPGAADSAPEVIAGTLDLYRDAMRQEAEGGPAAAVDALRQLAATRPEIPQLALEHARRLQYAGRLEEAAAAVRALASRLPERPEPLAVLGDILLEQERPGEAQKAFAAALARPDVPVPVTATLHAAAARAALQRQDAATAKAEAVQAAEAGAGPAIVAFVEGRLLQEQGDAEGALAKFDAALAASPKAGPLLDELPWRRADALSRLERFPEAEAAYRAAIEERPRDARPYVSLATLCHAGGRDAQAAAVVDLLLRALPTLQGYTQAAKLWQVLGDPERADSLRRAIHERFAASAPSR